MEGITRVVVQIGLVICARLEMPLGRILGFGCILAWKSFGACGSIVFGRVEYEGRYV